MSLAAQQPSPTATNQQYLSSETFHAPSFGDDDFNLPPLGLNGVTQVPEPVQNGGYVPSQQSQSLGGVTDTNYNYQSHSPQQSPQQPPPQYMQNGYHSNGYVASHTGLLAPKFPPPQTFDSIPDINSSYSPSNYTAVSSNNNSQQQQQHLQSAPQQQFMNSNPMQGSHHSMPRHSNHNYFVTPSHPVSAYSGGMHPHHPHAQQGGMGVMHPGAGHYGLHRGALPGYSSHNGIHPPGGVLSRMHNGMMSASPTGSNNTSSPGRESGSEESSSDDSIHNGLKRGAAEMVSPIPPVTVAKKPKTPKKRKKKDPNEPQKPVSAYALFFRDTQAAIKGQNPNASFGEVSKIVASMWDNLDAQEKANYKKRTEMAKKEYLKQLAAYRASLVSQQTTMDTNCISPVTSGILTPPPPSRSIASPIGAPPLTHMPPPHSASHLAHSQGMMMPPPPLHNSSLPGQPGMGALGPRPQHLQPGGGGMGPPPNHMGAPMSQGGNFPGQHHPQSQQQLQQQPPPAQQGGSGGSPQGLVPPQPPQTLDHSPPEGSSQSGWPSSSGAEGGGGGGYPGNECVANNCRYDDDKFEDVFTAWVASRQSSHDNSSYASVK